MSTHIVEEHDVKNTKEHVEKPVTALGDTIGGAPIFEIVLYGLSKQQLFAESDHFVREHGLDGEQDVFRQVALLAQ